MNCLTGMLFLLASTQAQLPGMFSYFGPGAWGAYPGNLFYNYNNFYNYYNNMYTSMYPGFRPMGQFGPMGAMGQFGPMGAMGQFGPMGAMGQFGPMGPYPNPMFGFSGPQNNDD